MPETPALTEQIAWLRARIALTAETRDRVAAGGFVSRAEGLDDDLRYMRALLATLETAHDKAKGDGAPERGMAESAADYVSGNVFDGTRPLDPDHAERLRMRALERETYKRGVAVGLMAGAVIARESPNGREAYKRIKAEADKLNVFDTQGANSPVDGEAEYNSWLQNAGDVEMASWR
jgi:hypothetical protein